MEVGSVDDRRNFTHVSDIVEAYWLAMEHCTPGQPYLIGSSSADKIFSFREALELLISMSTVEGITYETVPKFTRPTNVPFLIADTSEFQALSGWTPCRSFSEILSETLTYWRRQVELGR